MKSHLGSTAMSREAVDLHRALTDLIRVYQFRDRDRVCCFDISVTQSHALDRLRSVGPLTLNELAAALYLEKSTTSRIVDGLERKGYVERQAHPDDGRRILLDLTAPGARLIERVEEDLVREETSLLAHFSPEERRTITRGVQLLAGAAAARVDTAGGSCCRIA